jgi:hypothetical protein
MRAKEQSEISVQRCVRSLILGGCRAARRQTPRTVGPNRSRLCSRWLVPFRGLCSRWLVPDDCENNPQNVPMLAPDPGHAETKNDRVLVNQSASGSPSSMPVYSSTIFHYHVHVPGIRLRPPESPKPMLSEKNLHGLPGQQQLRSEGRCELDRDSSWGNYSSGRRATPTRAKTCSQRRKDSELPFPMT